MSEKVLITGGSGLVGRRLTALLQERGYQVVHLGRKRRQAGVETFVWHPEVSEMDDEALDGTGAVIHLAGASIAGRRWTTSYKKKILDSRLHSTRLLLHKMQLNPGVVRIFISASAIGYYGSDKREASLTEEDLPGEDFLATVVRKWEAGVEAINAVVPRVCMVRTGIVLSREGGALTRMAMPVRLGLGAPLGSGKQVVSWVHIDDLCKAYIFLLENQLSGPFNVTAPKPVSNEVLTHEIAKKLGRPLWLPNIPGFVLKIVLGEMADAVLTGSAVSSEKIVEKGFRFEYNNIHDSLADLI